MLVWSVLSNFTFLVTLAWIASEIILARLTHSKADSASGLDRWSLRILWLAICVSVTLGVILGTNQIGFITSGGLVISICGLGLIIFGLIVRWVAIVTLRKHFTVDVNIGESHELIMTGIYGILRHPAYTGSLMSFLGLGLTFSSWVSALVICVPICMAFAYRIKVEERALRAHFGMRYEEYAKNTKRLIPLIY